jgi:hypothetical protein
MEGKEKGFENKLVLKPVFRSSRLLGSLELHGHRWPVNTAVVLRSRRYPSVSPLVGLADLVMEGSDVLMVKVARHQ